MGYNGYNTAQGQDVNEKNIRSNGYMISTGWDSAKDDYLAWDFGYTCYMPQNIVVDNFKTGIATFHIFENIPDVAFNNPYGKSYVAPKSITIRNMPNMPASWGVVQSTGCTVLKNVPIYYENDAQ